MKRIDALLILVLLGFTLAPAQKKTVKNVHITAKTIITESRSGAYVIDLSRDGTFYSIDADVDLNAVEIRTRDGQVTLSEAMRKLGISKSRSQEDDRGYRKEKASGSIFIGLGSDLLFQELPMLSTGRSVGYKCSGPICTCTSLADCFRMGTEGVCGPITVCTENVCTCSKSKTVN